MRSMAVATKSKCSRCGGDDYLTCMEDERATAVLCRHLADCKGCRGTGFSRRLDGAYEVMQPCSCELLATQKRVELFNLAGVPGRFHDASIQAYVYDDGPNGERGNQFRFRTLFTELCDGFTPGDRGVGLSGVPGVGKTHLLSGLARYFTLERGIAVRFADFAELLWSLKAGFAAGRSEDELVRPLANIPVLFIDEMGKGRGSDWELSILDAIISERYNRDLSTFFASNYPFEDKGAGGFDGSGSAMAVETLSLRLGGRVWSRLQEMCRLETVRGPDARTSGRPGAGRRA